MHNLRSPPALRPHAMLARPTFALAHLAVTWSLSHTGGEHPRPHRAVFRSPSRATGASERRCVHNLRSPPALRPHAMVARPTFACPYILGVHAYNCRSHRPAGSRCASQCSLEQAGLRFATHMGPVPSCAVPHSGRQNAIVCPRSHASIAMCCSSNRGLGPCVRGLAALDGDSDSGSDGNSSSEGRRSCGCTITKSPVRIGLPRDERA